MSGPLLGGAVQDIFAHAQGSGQFYRDPLTRLLYTDSIKMIADVAGAYWLITDIGSYQPKLKTQEFQIWTLDVKDHKGTLTMREDSNQPILVKQEYQFTDFPEGSWKFYVEQGQFEEDPERPGHPGAFYRMLMCPGDR